MKYSRGPAVSGPSSSLGILRFFDEETPGPKLTPEFVVVASALFAVAFIAIHLFS